MTGPGWIVVVVRAAFLIGVSSCFIFTGVRDINRREAVITHKHAPSEHVTGARAVNEGIRELLLGAAVLGIGGFRLLKRVSQSLSGLRPEAPTDNPPDGSNTNEETTRVDQRRARDFSLP